MRIPWSAPADPGFDEWIAGCQAGLPLACGTRASCRWPRSAVTPSEPGFQLALSCDLRVLADDAQLCMKSPRSAWCPT